MKVTVSRVRHPLACFKGEISVEGEKTAVAEEIKLAFDYYPVIDGQVSTTAKADTNGNGAHLSASSGNGSGAKAESKTPRFVKYETGD
jgi:hypothetical protein